MDKLTNDQLLAELEVPFAINQVLWRVTNTANNGQRGQVVAYADPRAYTDRLNQLLTPQGWTRTYETTTMNNITRAKKNAEIVSGKILVTCKVTITGLGTHSGTGEEWADEEYAMTAAEAQAFKRACSCFGLGRYLYDFEAPWVDLDEKRRPAKLPCVPGWMIPEIWRKGMRPPGRGTFSTSSGTPANGQRNGEAAKPPNGNGTKPKPNGGPGTEAAAKQIDNEIRRLEESVGRKLYLGILREHGQCEAPERIMDVVRKKKVLSVLQSASRGIRRMEAALDQLPEGQARDLLEKIQAPGLHEIGDMRTLVGVVTALEGVLGSRPSSPAV